ncbi:hypothetical protein FOZ61_003580 [Perkinsus olseni]|uniref:DNA-directed RNA polymerases I, II, and III subunit RPABC4 n=1 Tax=Perkinsus olseni TaxID=32597 RepID=A0A7J6LP93_PEROL|nr:hypothetical protein FOL46_005933 [Perkinsus olseni]KAF4661076.1 hypothetical protein FOZ61_003580 [Perkinsus olseni]
MSTADGGFDFDAVLRADNPPAGGDAADNNTAGMFGGGIADLESQVAVTYLCGECGAYVDIKPHDAVRCRECGHRILYKLRQKQRPCIYEAR